MYVCMIRIYIYIYICIYWRWPAGSWSASFWCPETGTHVEHDSRRRPWVYVRKYSALPHLLSALPDFISQRAYKDIGAWAHTIVCVWDRAVVGCALTVVYVSSYYCTCVLILLYVSSYHCTCVLVAGDASVSEFTSEGGVDEALALSFKAAKLVLKLHRAPMPS